MAGVERILRFTLRERPRVGIRAGLLFLMSRSVRWIRRAWRWRGLDRGDRGGMKMGLGGCSGFLSMGRRNFGTERFIKKVELRGWSNGGSTRSFVMCFDTAVGLDETGMLAWLTGVKKSSSILGSCSVPKSLFLNRQLLLSLNEVSLLRECSFHSSDSKGLWSEVELVEFKD